MKKLVIALLGIFLFAASASATEFDALYKLANYLEKDAMRLSATASSDNQARMFRDFYDATKAMRRALRDINEDYTATREAYYTLSEIYTDLKDYMNAGGIVVDEGIRFVWEKKVRPKYLALDQKLFAMRIITNEQEYVETRANPHTEYKYKVEPQYQFFNNRR
jgi:hypothetical protein